MNLFESLQEEGEYIGKKEFLIRALENKFSQSLSDDIKDKIEETDKDGIDTLIDNIFEIESPEAIRNILEK
ncbi:hypothetical protein [Halarsenatibacter silvermanii]|uniref:DUF4351 domain-containing protein n=1 Tax=Halarsenatibacter silvermanii TaxID=321763 RepID=A0A1G9TYW5_9FIRM|nr:hypothetical protein [Halarsenatibacter silvermanii]SDM52917.1 hypothetical protein SAMN04488692_1522 [Halarsenatibacter silvermanii]